MARRVGPPVVYLAHPIDLSDRTDDQVVKVTKALNMLGFTVFDPAEAWKVGTSGTGSPVIHDANLAVLERCDAMVWLFDVMTPSIGTVIEATDRGRVEPGSVFVLGPERLAKSVALNAEGWVLCTSVGMLIQMVEQFFHEKGI